MPNFDDTTERQIDAVQLNRPVSDYHVSLAFDDTDFYISMRQAIEKRYAGVQKIVVPVLQKTAKMKNKKSQSNKQANPPRPTKPIIIRSKC